MISPDTPIESIPKISRRIVPALKHLGIRTVRDLLFHFPARYEDFLGVKSVSEVRPRETVTIQGRILKITTLRTARKRMAITEAVIEDGTGKIKAVWFNQSFLARNLKIGDTVQLSGKTALGKSGLYLSSPAYEKINYRSPTSRGKSDFGGAIHTGGLVPIYPETAGITSRWLRYLVKNFLELRNKIPDSLPAETRERRKLPGLSEALRTIHFPKDLKEADIAQRRFSFEEMLLFQLRALRERARLKQKSAPVIALELEAIKNFVSSLPFPLTNAQRRSIWEILKDLEKPRPMNRLLEGDVGSGKTVVAAAAALMAARAGLRTALMAPTEILARQHYETLRRVLAPFEIKTGMLVGSEKIGRDAQVLVGTHALIQKNIKFENLGLVIVDEQHRFGVEQRAALLRQETSDKRQVAGSNTEDKSLSPVSGRLLPHFLSMTATPIPRTLALTIYGDLDLSVLDEMPKNRKPVITKIVEPGDREEAYKFIRKEVKDGRQVFVICPRIESRIMNQESRENRPSQQKLLLAETKAVKEEYQKLSEKIFPNLRIDMLHGKMKSKEKEEAMKKFKNRETDILVSTSVVEVGVDIPNASIMMIEGAERFGLAQLHQFRGRVGRGAEQSYCFLFPTPLEVRPPPERRQPPWGGLPLTGQAESGIVTRRLKAVAQAQNGFELAEQDLKIRGPGDIFGTRQWGVSDRVLKGLTNPELVREVREEARELIKKSPDISLYPGLLEYLQNWEEKVHPE